MKTTELKTKIRAHLEAAGENTAKKIAKAIGHADYPSEVVHALGEMRTDAEVECGKKKGMGNEYWYWLTNVAKPEQANPAEVVPPTDKECCNAARIVATTAGSEVAMLREQLVAAERQRDDHFERAESHKNRLNDLSGDLLRFFSAVQQITGSHDKPASLADCEAQVAGALAMLRGQIDEVITAAADLEQAVDVKQAAAGYIVRVPGKKPRICTKPENAHAAAMSGARQHGRADVLAMVPIGKAIRGAEWKDAA